MFTCLTAAVLMPALLAGQVQFYFSPMAQAIEYVGDGRLRALGVTTATRSDLLPDVPTIGEFVPGFLAIGWYGICVPRGTPTPIIDKLSTAIIAGLADTNLKARLRALGIEPRPMTPACAHRAGRKHSRPTRHPASSCVRLTRAL